MTTKAAVDVYLTGLGGNRLFHNEGGGRFRDVTVKAGTAGGGFGTGAAFFDYDKDGKIRPVVTNYVQWSLEKDSSARWTAPTSPTAPRVLHGQSRPVPEPRRRDFRGRDGQGRLADANPRRSESRCWTTTTTAGWTCSWQRNPAQQALPQRRQGDLHRRGHGRVGSPSGSGRGPRGMGTDAGDYDGAGRPSSWWAISRRDDGAVPQEGTGLFIDDAATTAIGQSTLLSLRTSPPSSSNTTSTAYRHLRRNAMWTDDIQAVQAKVRYAQPPHLFRNLGNKKFEAADDTLGPA